MDDVKADEILALYTQLSAVTTHMRQAANAGDWEAVIALEAQCTHISSRLIEREDGAPRTADYQRRKADLIRKVLEDDAEIRQNVNERLAGLWRLIDGRQKIERLNTAYGAERGIPRMPGL